MTTDRAGHEIAKGDWVYIHHADEGLSEAVVVALQGDASVGVTFGGGSEPDDWFMPESVELVDTP